MKNTNYIAFLPLWASCVLAAPLEKLNKRDLIVVTDWDIVTEIVDVVQTVYVDATAAAAETTYVSSSAPAPAPLTSTSVLPLTSSTPLVLTTTTTSTPVVTSEATATSETPIATSIITSEAYSPSEVPASSTLSVYVDPTTTTAAAISASTSAATEKSNNDITGLAASDTSYTGDITYYATGLGSCGWTSGYNDAIVAVSHDIMDVYNPPNPNDNPLCGRGVTINYGGQQFQATVVDTCGGCAQGDLDLSEGFFSTVTGGDTAAGRIHGVSWSWN